MRRIIALSLGKHPGIEVAGFASNGLEAIEAVGQLKPDLVTLDIEMPEMDGLAALREIRKTERRMPIIMFSTLTHKGAQATILALTRGASDYVEKPGSGSIDMEGSFAVLASELIPKVLALGGRYKAVRTAAATHDPVSPMAAAPAATALAAPAPSALAPSVLRPARGVRFARALCIGVSTGGPVALMDLFAQLEGPLTVPIFIVQHIPASFSALLAARLSTAGEIEVREAQEGDIVRPGLAYLAPGDRHMMVERTADAVVIRLNQAPHENSCRPSVDVLMRSAARVYGNELLAVMMTGMGSDGLLGCREVSERNGQIIVQDEESSVVWGMPGAVARAQLAEAIVPLSELGQSILSRITRVRSA
jgi:two-component system chemotaxis response regulator CheB